MKHIYSLILLVFMSSCSETEPVGGIKDPDGNPDNNSLEACFTLSDETLLSAKQIL